MSKVPNFNHPVKTGAGSKFGRPKIGPDTKVKPSKFEIRTMSLIQELL